MPAIDSILMVNRAIAFRAVELASPAITGIGSLKARPSPKSYSHRPESPAEIASIGRAYASTDRALISSQTVDDARRCTHCEG